MPNPLTLTPMSIQDAELICSWAYEPPYHCYQFPTWQHMREQDREFANDQIREQQYRSLYNGELFIGFVQLFPLLNVIRLAIFLAPQHCNRGLGRHAVSAAVEAAQKLNSKAEIDLEVECWNERAIACYTKSGFVITDQYEYIRQGSIIKVYCMVYSATI